MLNKVQNNDLSQAKQQPLAVLDFSATWCGPCRMLAPIIDEMADELDGRAEFYSIDVDDNPAAAAAFGVQSIPCIVVLKNGQIAEQTVGFRPKEAMHALLAKYL